MPKLSTLAFSVERRRRRRSSIARVRELSSVSHFTSVRQKTQIRSMAAKKRCRSTRHKRKSRRTPPEQHRKHLGSPTKRVPARENDHDPIIPPPKYTIAHPAEPHLAESLCLDPRDLLLAADGGDPEVSLGDEVFLAPAHAAELPVVETQPRLTQPTRRATRDGDDIS